MCVCAKASTSDKGRTWISNTTGDFSFTHTWVIQTGRIDSPKKTVPPVQSSESITEGEFGMKHETLLFNHSVTALCLSS